MISFRTLHSLPPPHLDDSENNSRRRKFSFLQLSIAFSLTCLLTVLSTLIYDLSHCSLSAIKLKSARSQSTFRSRLFALPLSFKCSLMLLITLLSRFWFTSTAVKSERLYWISLAQVVNWNLRRNIERSEDKQEEISEDIDIEVSYWHDKSR